MHPRGLSDELFVNGCNRQCDQRFQRQFTLYFTAEYDPLQLVSMASADPNDSQGCGCIRVENRCVDDAYHAIWSMLPEHMRIQAVGDFLCVIEAEGRVLLRDCLIQNSQRLSELTPAVFQNLQRWLQLTASEIIANKGETETPELRDYYSRAYLTVLLYEWAGHNWPSPTDVPTTQPHPIP